MIKVFLNNKTAEIDHYVTYTPETVKTNLNIAPKISKVKLHKRLRHLKDEVADAISWFFKIKDLITARFGDSDFTDGRPTLHYVDDKFAEPIYEETYRKLNKYIKKHNNHIPKLIERCEYLEIDWSRLGMENIQKFINSWNVNYSKYGRLSDMDIAIC